MNEKKELILKNLKKVDDYLRNLDVSEYEFEDPFTCRIGKPGNHTTRYRVEHSRWLFTADFAHRKFFFTYIDWWISNHETQWFEEKYSLKPSKERVEELEEHTTDYDDFFVYAEGFLERWPSIKSRINAYFQFNSYQDSVNNLKNFKV